MVTLWRAPADNGFRNSVLAARLEFLLIIDGRSSGELSVAGRGADRYRH